MAATESNTQGSFAQDLRHIVEDADQLLKTAAKAGDSQFDSVRDKLQAQLRRMRGQLDEIETAAVQRARAAARATDEAVHSHPYAAIGIGAAVGLLVGVLIARR